MLKATNLTPYYIGIMSGTSLDGVDVVLVEFKDSTIQLLSSHCEPIPDKLQQQLLAVINPNWRGSLSSIGELHQQLGELFASAVNRLLERSDKKLSQISAIGSHGQTAWHQPTGEHPFSLQLGDANQIAELTGISVVADFRSRDIAANGQGAPLVPAFHQKVLTHPKKNRIILNIGGIANITFLPATSNSNNEVTGFDTGPGNGLMDSWVYKHKHSPYDKNGEWARSGKVLSNILEQLLNEPYFSSPAPKSTGKEIFNLSWVLNKTTEELSNYKPEDIQATLTELTAITISLNIKSHKGTQEYDGCYVCGGGARNAFLMERLQQHLPDITVDTTQKLGIDPDWMEAIAFAWLAKRTMEGKTGNSPSSTGANGPRILGAIYQK